jgi:hypothetical protein
MMSKRWRGNEERNEIFVTAEKSHSKNRREKNFEENFNLKSKKSTKYGTRSVKIYGPSCTSSGRNRPSMA